MSVWANVNTIIVSVNTYSFSSVWWFYTFVQTHSQFCKALLENKGVFPSWYPPGITRKNHLVPPFMVFNVMNKDQIPTESVCIIVSHHTSNKSPLTTCIGKYGNACAIWWVWHIPSIYPLQNNYLAMGNGNFQPYTGN